MKKNKTNVLLLIGVLILCVLLMVWLFLGTTLEEEGDPVVSPYVIEQTS